MKKLLPLLNLFILGVFFVSCSTGKDAKMEKPVSGLLDSIKNMKVSSETLPNYIENYSNELAPITSFTEGDEPNKEDVYHFFFGHMSYKISKVNKIDENTYGVLTSIKNIGSNSFSQRYTEEVSVKALEDVFSQIDPNDSQSLTEEAQLKLIDDYNKNLLSLMKGFKFKDSDFLTTEYTFTVKKSDNSDDYKIVFETAESLNDFYLAINPSEPSEEVITEEVMVIQGNESDDSMEEIVITE